VKKYLKIYRNILIPIMMLTFACSTSKQKANDLGTDKGADIVVATDVPDVPDVKPLSDSTDAAVNDITVDADAQNADIASDPGTETGTDVLADTQVPDGLPRKLPFKFTRSADGDPIPAADVKSFTSKVTGLWKKIDYARWILRTSEGVDPSTGKDDYLAWYNDMVATKKGDTVTFSARGGEHNMWISGSMILSVAINGYLLTDDWTYGKLAEEYCKGLSAMIKGFVWDKNDPAPFLMPRSIFPMDQDFTLDADHWKDDGRHKIVIFSTMYQKQDGWNAHTFKWPHNPTWGYEYVTNMRSKDDVRAIVRTTTFLPYILKDAPAGPVRDACQETMDMMIGFNKDIVDHGYYIRTKDADGKARKVTEQDLGNYVQYISLDKKNECTARLSSDLIAYRKPLTNDCGNGWGTIYEKVATSTHYYNYSIVWDYHMAALGNALVYGYYGIAYRLLEGMAIRMDTYMDPNTKEPGAKDHEWGRDMAMLLVQAASMGLPLTAREARHVQKHWLQAVKDYENWSNWDLWSDKVPDGDYGTGGGIRPRGTDDGIAIEAIGLFLEYCNSPFKNPAGATFVDCDMVKDIASWGK